MMNRSSWTSTIMRFPPRRTLMVVVAILSSSVRAADWPRFLGPQANSISSETGINKDWSAKPPKEHWRVPMTDEGFSGPAIRGKTVYLHDHVGEEDVIRALEADTGKELWRFTYPEAGDENDGFTRATPTVDGDYLYTVSRSGLVHCLAAADGGVVWRADVMKDHGGKPPRWGAANSALIDGDRLIAIAAGDDSHVVALDKKNGKEIWAGGGTDIAGYGTPAVAVLDGKKQYLVFTGKSFIGVAADDGTLLWRHPWETRLDSNACAPIVVGDNLVWIASGYRRGCALLRIEGDQITEVWSEKRITPHWSSAVLMDGHIYATTPPGYLVCVEAETGKEKWRSKGTARGFEHGGLCAADGTLIVIEGNTGNVVQVAISPEAYQEFGRINPLESSRCWVAPVVAHGRLYVRSPKELVCLDITQ
jgi:outer membrane protein assembly factor BamB